MLLLDRIDRLPRTAVSAKSKIKQALVDHVDLAFWIAIGLMLVSVWYPRLVRSLWVDEAGTVFMAHRGPLAAIQITSHWPGQSILYAVIESFFVWGGSPLRDSILRIPSIAGILLAAWFLYRLAEKAFGKGAGFVAAVLFIFHPSIISLGIQARPYSLALAAVTGSCLAVYEWIESREIRFILYFVAASTLVVYLHYFFAIVFLCQALYIAYVFTVEKRVHRWRYLLAAYTLIAVLITPLVPHIRLLVREAHTLPFTPAPTLNQFCESLLSPMLSLGLFLAAFLVQFAFPNSLRRPQPVRRSLFVLLLSWWLLAPSIFFAASVATPMRIFVPRYIASAVPGQTLLLAYAGYSLFQALPARFWVLCWVLPSTLSLWLFSITGQTGKEELGPFVRIIQAHSRKNVPPVFFSSQLPESDFYDWKAGLGNQSYLYAPFVAYPMKNRLLPLPFTLDTEAVKAHIEGVIHSELAETPEVIFVSHSFDGEKAWTEWLRGRMKDAGFTADAQTPNGYHVLIFTRYTAAGKHSAGNGRRDSAYFGG